MSDFLKKYSKYANWTLIVYVGLVLIVDFCSFINLCSNGNKSAGYIIGELFMLIVYAAILGALIYGVLKKKEKLLLILSGALFVNFMVNNIFQGDYIFKNIGNAFINNNTALSIVNYITSAINHLVVFVLAVLVFIHAFKKDKKLESASSITALVSAGLYVILSIFVIVFVCQSKADWYAIISSFANIVSAVWIVMVINHAKYLGTENASETEEK